MNYKKMLSLDAYFEGGRMFVGATSVTYLLSAGLDITQISLLKSIQALTILFGEYPTGVIADRLGRKKSLYLSLLSAILGFLLFALGSNFFAFTIAEILTALSLCFWSGAYEAYAIEVVELDKTDGLMDKYFHTNQSLNSAAVLAFGALGGLMAEKANNLPYFGGTVILFLGLIMLLTLPVEKHLNDNLNNKKVPFWIHVKSSLEHGVFSKNLLPFMLMSIAIQFSIQPLLHLWQPYFAELRGISETTFNSLVFTFYCIMNIIAGLLAVKYSTKSWFKSQSFLILTMAIFSVGYIFVGLVNISILALIAFGLTQGVLSVGRTALGIKINQNIVNRQSRASILSAVSLFSRFGMLAALQWMQILNKQHLAKPSISIIQTFSQYTALLIGLVAVLIFTKYYFKNKRVMHGKNFSLMAAFGEKE